MHWSNAIKGNQIMKSIRSNLLERGDSTSPNRILYLLKSSDPTKTTTLRKQFSTQFSKRFSALKKIINESIINNDCFGLVKNQSTVSAQKNDWLKDLFPIGINRFKFRTDPEKINSFMEWLSDMENKSVAQRVYFPQIGVGIEPIWTNTFIRRAYSGGIIFARQHIKANKELLSFINKTKNDFPTDDISVNDTLGSAFHSDRIGTVYTRVFTDLEGITKAMDAQISRELADGLVRGLNPREIARNIVDRVNKIGITRATILARTEVIRANHLAAIQEYRNAGITAVQVKAEWSTAGDYRVCELCRPLEGKIFDLDKIEGMIPVHPQCRCAALPSLPEVS